MARFGGFFTPWVRAVPRTCLTMKKLTPMIEKFTQELLRSGYDVSTRTVEPNRENKLHAHPFEVRALMVGGEMTLQYEGRTQVCRAGDVFTMPAGCEHEEHFGPEGASYVVGRRLAVD